MRRRATRCEIAGRMFFSLATDGNCCARVNSFCPCVSINMLGQDGVCNSPVVIEPLYGPPCAVRLPFSFQYTSSTHATRLVFISAITRLRVLRPTWHRESLGLPTQMVATRRRTSYRGIWRRLDGWRVASTVKASTASQSRRSTRN